MYKIDKQFIAYGENIHRFHKTKKKRVHVVTGDTTLRITDDIIHELIWFELLTIDLLL